jgi:2-dehydro-3-deoxyphosphogluconate aldolase/(4S)-4-hydroxy-2-oxoglutarate aldolase
MSMLGVMSVPQTLIERIREARILAVVTLESPDQAIPLAEALTAGGISGLELTLRTAAGLESISRIKASFPSLLVGAGTVLNAQQIAAVQGAGADFAVAPGFNPEVVRAAQTSGLPFVPGVSTPSEIERALAQGCRLLKFFPAEPSGGLKFLEAIAGPYLHLGIHFLPLGGIHPGNVQSYLASPIVAAVGGSWIAPPDRLKSADWDDIRLSAGEARQLAVWG